MLGITAIYGKSMSLADCAPSEVFLAVEKMPEGNIEPPMRVLIAGQR